MRARFWAVLLVAAALACNGDKSVTPDPNAALVLAILEGDEQTTTVGSAVSTDPAVRVTSNGSPASGVTVQFAVASGGGTVTGATQTTDNNGVARVETWTLGTTAGVNTLTASVADAEGSPVTFEATGTPGAVAQLVKQAGDEQVATVGSDVAVAPTVEVRDQYGNRIAGQQVVFTVTGGEGSATGVTQTSNANGIASVGTWTLGAAIGLNTLRAAAGSITADFTAMATAGAAANVSKQDGDNQTAAAGTQVTVRPSVRVSDEFGNPVAGVQVTFAANNGTVTGATQTTDEDGIAAVGSWTLAQAVGDNSLTATVDGDDITGNPVTFTANGIAGAPASMAKFGDNQTATVNTAVAIAPAVEVSDQFSNLISGQSVVFEITGGNGSITGGNAMTDANGRATLGSWILGSQPGANTLSATAGTVTVTFTATGTAAFDATQFVGTYSGNWVNNTFQSVGTGTVVISLNENTNTATAQITVTGNVLGSGVGPSSPSVTYGPAGATFNDNHNVMGTVTASIDAEGNIVASGTNVPNPQILRWDATGTATAAQILLDFTVTFTSGPPATGTITLARN